jgi:hypothetical protein
MVNTCRSYPMHLRYTAWLVLSLMTATFAGCNNVTAPNQGISDTVPIAQSDSVAQSAALAQSGAVVQTGAIAQARPVAPEPPSAPVAQSGAAVQSGAIAQAAPVAPSEPPSAPIAQSGPIAPSEPPSAPDPSYPGLIADHLKTTFKDYLTYDLFEISTPRWVHSFQGWNWLVCVRFLDRGRKRSYALLFNSDKVLDSHFAYQTDNCGIESYVVFEKMRGLGLPPLH